MSKNICLCGNSHEAETPLVITITACSNKDHTKHKSKGTPQTTSAESSQPNQGQSSPKQKHRTQKNSGNFENKDSEIALNNLLFCDDKDFGCPARALSKPAEKGKSSINKALDLLSFGRSSSDNKKLRNQDPTKLNAEDKVPGMFPLRKGKAEKAGQADKKEKTEKSVGNTPKSTSAVQATSAKSLFKNSTYTTSPSKDFTASNAANTSKVNLCCTGIGADSPKTGSCCTSPSDTDALKLPTLLPRFHGQGCAIEVNIMEKHDKKCSYKKQKNPDRKSDDKSGSYEVIGRLVFKTCQQGNKGPENAESPKNPKSKVRMSPKTSAFATVYSLINTPLWINVPSEIHPTLSKSDRQLDVLDNYLKRSRVLESLAKSSKSFPTNLCRSSTDCNSEQSARKEPGCCSVTSYDVEELFIFEDKANKSVQISESKFKTQKQKSWFYFLFPCLYSEESYSSLLLYSEGKERV